MPLTRWSPVRDLASTEVELLNQMFGSMFPSDSPSRGGWMPPVDVTETAGKDVVVKVDLPGMKREDISVMFENNVLTIEGERKLAAEKTEARYQRVERGHGHFRRSFTLPASVDGARIAASHVDGVLTVTLPRREETRPRQIEVVG